jgi:hypothetical protein
MWHYGDDAGLEASLTTMVGVTCHQPATQRAVTAFARLMQRRCAASRSWSDRGRTACTTSVARRCRPWAASARRRVCSREALRGAAWCPESWKEAVLRAVSAGGDADARGAPTGQLAGAVFGVVHPARMAGWP